MPLAIWGLISEGSFFLLILLLIKRLLCVLLCNQMLNIDGQNTFRFAFPGGNTSACETAKEKFELCFYSSRASLKKTIETQ